MYVRTELLNLLLKLTESSRSETAAEFKAKSSDVVSGFQGHPASSQDNVGSEIDAVSFNDGPGSRTEVVSSKNGAGS